MRVLFKNGTVVSGKGTRRADVLVDGEKIRRVAREIHVDDAQIVDAAGMLLMPGFIDAHTHFDLDVCNTTTADDFASGSRAALRGGTTTIVDFACPNAPRRPAAVAREGGRQVRLRLRLPHDHRRLERYH